MFLPARRYRGVLIGLVLLGVTPLSATAVSPAKKFPKCCVWRVTNAGAPFYLVGSIHALSKKDYPLPAPYDRALKDSMRFVFEFDQNRVAELEKKLRDSNRLTNMCWFLVECQIATANSCSETRSLSRTMEKKNSAGCTRLGGAATPTRFGRATRDCAEMRRALRLVLWITATLNGFRESRPN